ncbi:MAG: lysylphosphatidylglycerol synthase transmembrane domain-containing protein [Terrimicrobiaceae bacterium]|nr:lysylphosphatidylglycerol synthase transmembrane domain-containing protein [Terrimicrobiaceae bacterium]
MHKRWLLVLLQTSVTVGLLAFFFHDAEFRRDAIEALRRAHPGWLALGVAIAGAENLVGVLRWRIFLRMLGITVAFWKSVQVCLVALFCNTFLLGGAGGDLVRAAYLIRQGAGKTDSLLSVIMDRVSGLAALICYTVVLCAWNFDWLMRSPKAALLVEFVIAYQAFCALLILGSLFVSVRGLTERLPRWAPFPEFVRKLGVGYAKLIYHWTGTLRAMAFSFVMVLGYFAVFFCTARAFGLNISFFHLATLMPIVDVISALPISIGGMGVREQVFVWLLGGLAAVPAAMAVSISLVGYLVNTSWGLVGAAILPLFKGIVRDARSAARPPGQSRWK